MSEKLIPFCWESAINDLRRVRSSDGDKAHSIILVDTWLIIEWSDGLIPQAYCRNHTDKYLRLAAPRVVRLQMYRWAHQTLIYACEIDGIPKHHQIVFIGEPFDREVPSE